DINQAAPLGRRERVDQVGEIGRVQPETERLHPAGILGFKSLPDGSNLLVGNAVKPFRPPFRSVVAGFETRCGVGPAFTPVSKGRPGGGRSRCCSKCRKARVQDAGPRDYGAVEKTRTSTGSPPQRPQRCASTNSATTAF